VISGNSSDPFFTCRENGKGKLNRNDLISMQENVIQTFVGLEEQGRGCGGEISAMEFGR